MSTPKNRAFDAAQPSTGRHHPHHHTLALSAIAVALLAGCGGSDAGLPQLTAAQPATLQSCATLASSLALPDTRITSSELVAEGGLTATGVTTPIPAHCLVKGKMKERTGPVDGAAYAIGFEIRMPVNWNGRFLYQANGGLDGSVVTALGSVSGGAPVAPALVQGFAVLSSDAGHGAPTPFFGLDPQARLDYGYQAVGTLTPMAKNLIKSAYGKAPDRSYLAGCSNGGRHAMVGASRYAEQYDGILAGNPGFHLPKAATTQLWKAQQYAKVAGKDASGQPDLTTAVTPAEFKLISSKIVEKCDALDGVADGQVNDVAACQTAFNLQTDVPTCTGSRDGSCISAEQKGVLSSIFAGPKNSKGEALYTGTWFDPGIAGSNFASWHFGSPATRDAGAVAFIFTTPPSTVAAFSATTGLQYALNFSMETDYPKMFATNATYTESPWSYMTPPNEADLSPLKNRGAKMIVFHGVADGVFSPVDTAQWMDKLQANHGNDAASFARLFLIPGMNHCSGGPATDQFDMLAPLVAWVEQGKAPDSVTAKARGAGANVVNTEVPSTWSANRTRPLCVYPKVARYNGTGDVESASSFSCK
ncbi:tannase/feruloyl esterase family alpha/beta hydrolase [Acidovorax sp. 106]|uniref:tannase/feruloyl esterase family alpha/beta hydrolase n=1 Tax=Acidovorax sp. 106 TaxID=2135637 RepID=UPI000EAB7B7C|nr:tannase/feruloyl esterase family alpha/beta hydrolase [Acidovorax sp. 106]RLJ38045.1 feruloyl esterase [Acidovorax sp. 106]